MVDPTTPLESNYRTTLKVYGVVQGVGFRPFIFRLATELELGGHVLNKGAFVEIELIGVPSAINSFVSRLHPEAPPLARIDSIESDLCSPLIATSLEPFKIIKSQSSESVGANVPPDIATCEKCLAELFSPNDRRHNYPFLNCVDCGPRFTVIKNLPYDRAETSLACFPMCADCAAEYHDPLNRRFHAEPTACGVCGPSLMFLSAESSKSATHAYQSPVFKSEFNEQALKQAVKSIQGGLIVGLKGLGGFQLVCDATNSDTITKLRTRKRREAKPFAMMLTDIDKVKEFCEVSDEEVSLLVRPSRPIVLLRKRSTATDISSAVAPTTNTFGIMLPYTPLHHLLVRMANRPLVVTSGNLSEEPIAAGNREALDRLSSIADVFLLNNRDIVSRYDDTVCSINRKGPFIIRRARGFAPEAIQLPMRATTPVLAMGGHLKNTFCLINDDKAYVSQHIGDLDTVEAIDFLKETLEHHIKLFKINPRLVAADLHPDYGSTRLISNWVKDPACAPLFVKQIESITSIQHHYAHIVSCMVENFICDPVIGVAFDGTGYGTDGTVWGGEFLICTLQGFRRVAALEDSKMPGANAAIKEPWRMALGRLSSIAQTRSSSKAIGRFAEKFGSNMVSNVMLVAKTKLAPSTTSCGRLFDTVASLLGLCDVNEYEGHAAVLLQQEAERYRRIHGLSTEQLTTSDCGFEINQKVPDFVSDEKKSQSFMEICTSKLISDIVEELQLGADVAKISAKFHDNLAISILNVCKILRTEHGLNKVCLSGGVFQNNLLTNITVHLLEEAGFQVYCNSLVPCNDGGLSLGQGVAALGQKGMLVPL